MCHMTEPSDNLLIIKQKHFGGFSLFFWLVILQNKLNFLRLWSFPIEDLPFLESRQHETRGKRSRTPPAELKLVHCRKPRIFSRVPR